MVVEKYAAGKSDPLNSQEWDTLIRDECQAVMNAATEMLTSKDNMTRAALMLKRYYVLLLIKGIPLKPIRARTKTLGEIMAQIKEQDVPSNGNPGWSENIEEMSVVFSDEDYTKCWNELEPQFRQLAQMEFSKLKANRDK